MHFRRFGQILAATTVTAVALNGAPAFAQDQSVSISVSNFTDFHGHLEQTTDKEGVITEMGAARLASLVKEVNKGQEYALTSSGDNVGGSAYISAISADKYTTLALNAMGLAASALGNHELDKGTEDLLNRIQKESAFPILGANVTKDGKPLLDASEVKVIDGVKVGFVGTVTENTKDKVSAALIPGVKFSDPVEATNAEAKRLKDSGEADVVVALFHEDAQAYAEKFNGAVDILFGGDTHLKTQGEVAREGQLPLYWAQGQEYGKVLNDADITFNKSTKKIEKIQITQYTGADAAELTDDAAVAEIVAQAKAEADKEGLKIAGTTEEAMFRGSNEGEQSGSNRGVESTLNNFIADGQRWALSQATGKEVDLGVMNAGGVRDDLKKGDVSFKEIFAVQPFGNSIITAKVSGQEILNALENQWKPEGSRPRLALGLSNNVQVVYDQKAEQGERVKYVTINGEALDPEKDYTVAMSSFLAPSETEAGGDGFFNAGAVKERNDVGYMDTQAMIDYIQSGKSELRKGQAQIGAHVEGELKAGSEITVDLSSLNYSTEGEPMAKTAKVALGTASAESEIDMSAQPDDQGFGERGRVSVTLTIPEDIACDAPLTITTDAGTEAQLPLDIENCVANTGGSSDGSSEGSSAAKGLGIAAAVIAALAAVVTVVGMNMNMLPAPVKKAIEDLRKQFNI